MVLCPTCLFYQQINSQRRIFWDHSQCISYFVIHSRITKIEDYVSGFFSRTFSVKDIALCNLCWIRVFCAPTRFVFGLFLFLLLLDNFHLWCRSSFGRFYLYLNGDHCWNYFVNPNLPFRLKINITFLKVCYFCSAQLLELVVPVNSSLTEFVIPCIADSTNRIIYTG